MFNIRSDINKIILQEKNKISEFKAISHLEFEEILKKITSKFLVINEYQESEWWWEHFKNLPRHSIHFKTEIIFQSLSKIIDRNESVWFIAVGGRSKFWVYQSNIESIQILLGEMYGFEYYIVNKKYEWIVCENHHNVLIGVGESIKKRLIKFRLEKFPIGIVKETFNITGRGLLVSLESNLNECLWEIGDKVKLKKNDGTEIESRICGITFQEFRDILIEEEYAKLDVPKGTEVWLVRK